MRFRAWAPITRQRLLEHFGSVRALKQAAEKNRMR